MIDEVLDELGQRMEKSVEVLQDDLLGIRTGRASPALVDAWLVSRFSDIHPVIKYVDDHL